MLFCCVCVMHVVATDDVDDVVVVAVEINHVEWVVVDCDVDVVVGVLCMIYVVVNVVVYI